MPLDAVALPFDRWWVSPRHLAPVVLAVSCTESAGDDVLRLAVSFHVPGLIVVGPKAAQRRFPQLQDKGLLFATVRRSVLVDGVDGPSLAPQVTHQAMHDDARTNIAIALTAAEKGAAVANYCEVTDLIKDAQGRAAGRRRARPAA